MGPSLGVYVTTCVKWTLPIGWPAEGSSHLSRKKRVDVITGGWQGTSTIWVPLMHKISALSPDTSWNQCQGGTRTIDYNCVHQVRGKKKKKHPSRGGGVKGKGEEKSFCQDWGVNYLSPMVFFPINPLKP